jgi:uncharacterized membrane protein
MTFATLIEHTGEIIDGIGVGTIVSGTIASFATIALSASHRGPGAYHRFRSRLGQSILLGLELLVAADIIRTVAVTPTIERVGVLGGIVIIRTFLSLTLELETSGAVPWRRTTPIDTTHHGKRPMNSSSNSLTENELT